MSLANSRVSFGERHAGLLAWLAALHLAMVCCFLWTHAAEGRRGVLADALRTYKNLSGIFRDYRFFAPAVASDLRAGFVLERADGTSWFEPFLSDNLEIGFRYTCIIGASMRDQRLRDLMAQSWSALMLGAHPEALRVTVVAQSFELPPLHAFAAGERASWKLIYAGVFDRRSQRDRDDARLSMEGAP
jgi:hypothetical protein